MLEITLMHTVDTEDNKYYLNNIMEKVIPKSKTKLLQNFFNIYIYMFRTKVGTLAQVGTSSYLGWPNKELRGSQPI